MVLPKKHTKTIAMTTSMKVAVIGSGVGGLVAARELKRESHQVVVFEKSHKLGGTWAYDPRVESDLLGIDPNREIVHRSLYKSLRTNLPRQLMSFTDFKFDKKVYGDSRMFPGHNEVLKFLEDFSTTFQITELIRFNTVVTRVEAMDSGITEFVVESLTNQMSSVEVFDAVVVCNGINTRPRLATDIPGIETWSKKQIHSHNYRVPEPFRNKIVVVIGSGPSGIDLSREIAMVAKEVHMSSRSPNVEITKLEKFNNIWQHSKIQCINKDGTISFQHGASIEADIIFHCTGLKSYASHHLWRTTPPLRPLTISVKPTPPFTSGTTICSCCQHHHPFFFFNLATTTTICLLLPPPPYHEDVTERTCNFGS